MDSGFRPALVVTFGGAATGLVAAYLSYVVAQRLRCDMSSEMFWIVIPVGAALVGAIAASGHYVTSLWTQCRATPQLALNIALIGLGTYALIQYAAYHVLWLSDGTSSGRQVASWLFYQCKSHHTSLQFARGHPSAGELGGLEYLSEVARIIGFSLGCAGVYASLRDKPYCTSCNRYCGRRQLLLETQDLAEVDRFARALSFNRSALANECRAVIGDRRPHAFKVTMAACRACDRTQVRFSAVRDEGETVFAIHYVRGSGPSRQSIERSRETALEAENTRDVRTSGIEEERAGSTAGHRKMTVRHGPSDPMSFGCWRCKAAVTFTEQERGRRVRCRECGQKQTSPRAPGK